MWFIHTATARRYRVAAGLGIGAIIFVVIALLMRLAFPPQNAMAPGNDTRPTSGAIVNQGPARASSVEPRGGISPGTIKVAPPRAGFTDEIGSRLLSKMPDRKKVIILNTMGDPADQKIGREVQNFLQKNGYQVQRFRSNTAVPTPEHPFMFFDNPDSYIVTVAPSVR